MTFRHFARRHLRAWARVGIAVVVFAGLLPGCGGQSYSCGDKASGHCYGVVRWDGHPTGFSMELTAVALTSGDGFVNDEGWLIDYFAKGDPIKGAFWAEAGELNDGGGTQYFWADNTPAGFTLHYLSPVAQSDIDSGAWIAYRISQDATPTTWNVTISQAATGTVLYAVQSTGNPMKPNTIEEGQELGGQGNAQAPLAFFAQNAVVNGGQTSFENTDGTVTANHPPNAGWWGVSHPPQTTDGGIFFTDCC